MTGNQLLWPGLLFMNRSSNYLARFRLRILENRYSLLMNWSIGTLAISSILFRGRWNFELKTLLVRSQPSRGFSATRLRIHSSPHMVTGKRIMFETAPKITSLFPADFHGNLGLHPPKKSWRLQFADGMLLHLFAVFNFGCCFVWGCFVFGGWNQWIWKWKCTPSITRSLQKSRIWRIPNATTSIYIAVL